MNSSTAKRLIENKLARDLASPQAAEPAKFYLHPGQQFVTAESYLVTTILGSCVSVCLWDASANVGGINHFLLPCASDLDQPAARFGNLAVRDLIAAMHARGAVHERMQAKLFGGACILKAFRDRENHLGATNVRVARQILAGAGIAVVAEDVGGHKGRKLIFQTDDGAAWVKRI